MSKLFAALIAAVFASAVSLNAVAAQHGGAAPMEKKEEQAAEKAEKKDAKAEKKAEKKAAKDEKKAEKAEEKAAK